METGGFSPTRFLWSTWRRRSLRRKRFLLFLPSLFVNFFATSANYWVANVIKRDKNYHKCPIGAALRLFINYIFIVYQFDVINFCSYLYNFGQTWNALALQESWNVLYSLRFKYSVMLIPHQSFPDWNIQWCWSHRLRLARLCFTSEAIFCVSAPWTALSVELEPFW
jgi:hypothetical protein